MDIDVSKNLRKLCSKCSQLNISMCPNRMMMKLQSAALVANLRQEVAEAKDTLKKNIEETAHQKAIEAIEVQDLNKVIRTLKDQNDEVQIA